MMIKCEMYSITLELTVGMARSMDCQQRLKDSAASLTHGHVSQVHHAVIAMQRRLEEGQEDNNEVLKLFGVAPVEEE